jgi:hypothetical protein
MAQRAILFGPAPISRAIYYEKPKQKSKQVTENDPAFLTPWILSTQISRPETLILMKTK